MTSLGVIPARAGSKGTPGQNPQLVVGVPLVARAVRSALRAHSIDGVVVSTDGERIAKRARREGAFVVDRPADLAADEASRGAAVA